MKSRLLGVALVLLALTLLALAVAVGSDGCRSRVSDSYEPLRVMGEIRGAEALQLAEHGEYLPGTTEFGRFYPASPDELPAPWDANSHPDYSRWKALDLDVSATSNFGYSLVAGRGPDRLPDLNAFREPPDWQVAEDEPWWIVVVEGPTNRQCRLRLASSSIDSHLLVESEPMGCE